MAPAPIPDLFRQQMELNFVILSESLLLARELLYQ